MVAQASCPGRAGPTPATSNSFRRRRRVQSSSSQRPWSSLAFMGLLPYLAWLGSSGGGGVARASWIDPDTLPEHRTKDFEGDDRQFDLVFSDEFDRDGRTFNDGRDPRWMAMNKNDYTNAALQFYSHDMCETRDGALVITTNNTDVEFQYYDTPHKKYKSMAKTYVSGMMQSWDKFCFTGGIVEIRAILPGRPDVGGLWPAMWLMGNLARATYTASSDFTWPWSYNKCNRTTDEQADWQRQQEISACDASVHYGFHPNTGRGAPEIDLLETMAGTKPGVAPGTSIEERPTEGRVPRPGTWYEEDIHYGKNSTLNKWFYGVLLEHDLPGKSYYADAVSSNHVLSETHFEDLHTYRLDWQPGGGDDSSKGYLRWYVDDELLYGISDDTLESFHGSQIPLEPMYLLLNTAVSTTWGFPDCHTGCACDCFDARDPACACAVAPGFDGVFPAEFVVDSVRVYQALNDTTHTLGCDTEQYPTKDFIKANHDLYKSPDDDHVMLSVQSGGGSCRTSDDCNDNECYEGKRCRCSDMWTGPRCLAATASYDYVYDAHAHDRWPMQPPLVPTTLKRLLAVLGATFAVTLLMRYNHRQKRRLYVSLDNAGLTIPAPSLTSQ
ncbi:Beta-1,6-glucan active enzyme, family GH16 [Ectocarpus siliculosus]|uniref:Beta-1,6-glucan active enzyme, family GH16 n=1 Tax=Ectocarpus siliculosus TaxID=2880 RepID=D7FT08_ECTSI|nr:Beta-1,6-glucan active enzyme, family GH16 [Ectocarpus siliculosus]|eukprot:CBJ31299.1 Beta-1,6-glucan active enzyme, family GH16 [Ectocarpus siliculosus]